MLSCVWKCRHGAGVPESCVFSVSPPPLVTAVRAASQTAGGHECLVSGLLRGLGLGQSGTGTLTEVDNS